MTGLVHGRCFFLAFFLSSPSYCWNLLAPVSDSWFSLPNEWSGPSSSGNHRPLGVSVWRQGQAAMWAPCNLRSSAWISQWCQWGGAVVSDTSRRFANHAAIRKWSLAAGRVTKNNCLDIFLERLFSCQTSLSNPLLPSVTSRRNSWALGLPNQ